VIVVAIQVVDVDIGVVFVVPFNQHRILRALYLLMKAVYHMILDVVVSFAVIVDMEVRAGFVMAIVLYVEGI